MTKIILPALLALIATQQAPRPSPEFKAQVTLVEVDVVVTDDAGRPTRGLGRDDFSLSEDGDAVEIATFTAIDVPDAPAPSVIPPPDRSGSAFASNERADDGRLMLIVLDDLQAGFSAGRIATVKAIARRAVERLGTSDVAGVMTTSGWPGGQAELTTDKRRLLEAIDRFVPRVELDLPAIATAPAVAGSEPDADRIDAVKTLSSMAGLSHAARVLATIPHRRKGVLLVSQGFPATLDEILRNPKIGAGWDAIREFVLTAQRSNVAVYSVDPCGLESDGGCTSESRRNLRAMAEATGGFAVTNTNAPAAAIDRMLAENGTYYLLGYASPARPIDGRHHRITVRTRVPGKQLRAREGYDSPAKAPQETAAAPLDALSAAALQTSGLPMRIVAIPAPLPSTPGAAVIVGIEVPAAAAANAGRIEFALVAIDDEGKTRARVRFATDFTAAQKTASPWTRTGSRIDLPPGRYQIRVAAVGSDRARGSVFTEVSVPKFDVGLALGGLSLGAPSSIAVTDADRLRGVLTLIPLATNTLAPGTALAVQLPIRVASKSAALPLVITATVVGSDGTTVTLDRSQPAARDYANAAGKVYRVALPQGLRGGTYRVVVEAALGATTAVREMVFSVEPQPR